MSSSESRPPSHTSDTGPFALVPIWVLDLPISHLALRLYAVHADFADRNGAHYHGRKALAERLGCTTQSIDDAHKALVAHGALEVRRRRDAQGDPASNLYIVCRVRPGVAKQETLPSQAEAATGSQAGAARTSSTSRSLNHHAGAREPAKPLTREELKRRVHLLRTRDEDTA